MLDREEYIEQSHLFRALAERIAGGVAAQEALVSIGQEVLATSKLPMAIDYLVGELKLVGTLSTAMARLHHYFSAFQTFVMQQAESGGRAVRPADRSGDPRTRGRLPRRGGDATGSLLLSLRVPLAQPARLCPWSHGRRR
jgi:hypothetical protein